MHKNISIEVAVCMTALLASHDLDMGDIESAKRMLNFLIVERLKIDDIKEMLIERLAISHKGGT